MLRHIGRGKGDSFIEILDLLPIVKESGTPYLVACTGTQGLTVWNTNRGEAALVAEGIGPGPANPHFPRCQHLAFEPDTRTLAISSRGDETQPVPFVWMYDMSDPANPVDLGGWEGFEHAEGLAWDGPNRLYVGTHKGGLLALDRVGFRLEPAWSHSDDTSDTWMPRIDRRDGAHRIWLAEGAGGLRAFDLEGREESGIPEGTLPIGAVALEGSTRDLMHWPEEPDHLVVASSGTLYSIDVADPTQPSIAGEVNTPGSLLDIAWGADQVVMTAEWDRVRAYRLHSPGEIELLGSELLPTDDEFSRALTVAAEPERRRVYGGEWTGMQAFTQDEDASAPDLRTRPQTLAFGDLAKGERQDRVLLVDNDGNAPLTVYSLATRGALSSNAGCTRIDPGATAALEVSFEAKNTSEFQSSVKVCSDDPDQPETRVPVSANVPGRGIGDPVPDFNLVDLDGNTWTPQSLEGKVAVLAYFATF